MQRSLRDLVTVSPPTFDRTAFSGVDRRLAAAHAPYGRAWLMARFGEGLQIRMLPPPLSGIVLFQPGRQAWRPIEGAHDALVVHDLRVVDGPDRSAAAARLWSGAEDFARYYGFSMVLAVLGAEDGLISPGFAPRRGWITVDQTEQGTPDAPYEERPEARLAAKILCGPVNLPSFPRDWTARAASIGPGPVIQTTGECPALEARVDRIRARAAATGIFVRHDALRSPEAARFRAVSPGATFSALLDGVRIGGAELADAQIISRFSEARVP